MEIRCISKLISSFNTYFMMQSLTVLLAAEEPEGIGKAVEFFEKGGVFMYILLLCSLASVAVIIYKAIVLGRRGVIPSDLETKLEAYGERGGEAEVKALDDELSVGDSVLHRLSNVVLARRGQGADAVQEAVQASAREEMVGMQAGIQVLEVVIVIAPLLGLLGTASGITTVFDGFGDVDDSKMTLMAQGVSEALTTTIAGLAVAVPSVIAHSVFNRKIERYAARLEVLLERFSSALRPSNGASDKVA